MGVGRLTPEQARVALEWWPRGVFDFGAAEEALRIVAGMRVEYAVQVPVATAVPGQPVWRYFVRLGNNGGAIITAEPGLATWETTEQGAKERAELHKLTGFRIVSRLVGEPEVAE